MTIILDGTTGITTPAINSSGDLELPGGTANGVLYLNGSKVATSGSALVFDGTNLGIGASSPDRPLHVFYNVSTVGAYTAILQGAASGYGAGISFQSVLGGTSTLAEMCRITADGEAAWNSTTANQDAGLRFYTALDGTVAERVRISAAGNLGVGSTSPAQSWTGDPARIFQLQGSTQVSVVRINSSGGSFGDLQLVSSASSEVGIYNFANGAMRFGTNSTERARITAAGDLGVGTTSPTTVSNYRAITVNGTNGGILDLKYGDTLGGRVVASSGGLSLETGGATALTVFTNNAERARITSGGVLQINTTASIAANYKFITKTGTDMNLCISEQSNQLSIEAANDAVTANVPLRIYANPLYVLGGETIVGGTTDNGAYNLQCNGTGVWGAGAYVNGSDARLKDNIQSIDSCLDVVNALRPVTFQYKPEHSKDQSVQTGFIAQELQQALAGKLYIDGLVQEGPEYLNVAYQNIIPLLTKAIQELKAEIDQLKGT